MAIYFSGGAQITSDPTSIIIGREDNSQIRIGDNFYPEDVLIDATLSSVLTDEEFPQAMNDNEQWMIAE